MNKTIKYIKQAWKSRTIRLNTYSFATCVLQLVLLDPAVAGITTAGQLLLVNAANNWLRTKTNEALEDKK